MRINITLQCLSSLFFVIYGMSEIYFVEKSNKYFEILGSRSSVAEDSGLLGCGTVLLGE
jgi:hypothetical protein